mmetsp:Transcript_1116/g.1520  ORF Transcript_1116/g.1520 Transcript_1116/m.1520 type:complete len:186 (-) Transcript_1116:851-1408(-)
MINISIFIILITSLILSVDGFLLTTPTIFSRCSTKLISYRSRNTFCIQLMSSDDVGVNGRKDFVTAVKEYAPAAAVLVSLISLGGFSIFPRLEGNEFNLLFLVFLNTAFDKTQQTLTLDKRELKEDMLRMREEMKLERKEDKEEMLRMRNEDKFMSQITAFFTLFVSIAAAYFNYAYTTFEIANK